MNNIIIFCACCKTVIGNDSVSYEIQLPGMKKLYCEKCFKEYCHITKVIRKEISMECCDTIRVIGSDAKTSNEQN